MLFATIQRDKSKKERVTDWRLLVRDQSGAKLPHQHTHMPTPANICTDGTRQWISVCLRCGRRIINLFATDISDKSGTICMTRYHWHKVRIFSFFLVCVCVIWIRSWSRSTSCCVCICFPVCLSAAGCCLITLMLNNI